MLKWKQVQGFVETDIIKDLMLSMYCIDTEAFMLVFTL